jgi:ABC-type multidrug transport system fused ATPase/permease subunit
MKKLFLWRTVVIVAHRLQTVMHADTIVVLDRWKIIQRWTHEQLLKDEQSVYKKLVDLQSWILKE